MQMLTSPHDAWRVREALPRNVASPPVVISHIDKLLPMPASKLLIGPDEIRFALSKPEPSSFQQMEQAAPLQSSKR